MTKKETVNLTLAIPKDVYEIVALVARHEKSTVEKVVIENLCNGLQADVDRMCEDFYAILDEEERA